MLLQGGMRNGKQVEQESGFNGQSLHKKLCPFFFENAFQYEKTAFQLILRAGRGDGYADKRGRRILILYRKSVRTQYMNSFLQRQ